MLGRIELALEEITRVLLDGPCAVQFAHLLKRRDHAIALVFLLGELSDTLLELAIDVTRSVHLGSHEALLRAQFERFFLVLAFFLHVVFVTVRSVLDNVSGDASPCAVHRVGSERISRAA